MVKITSGTLVNYSALHAKDRDNYWRPVTIVYASEYARDGFDLFFKARSKRHFQVLKRLLKVQDRDDLLKRYDAANQRFQFDKPSPNYIRTPFTNLMNLVNLDTT